MPKGLPEIYDKICQDLDESPFFEWITGNPATFQEGQVCEAIIYYLKRKSWYLEEHQYDSRNEPDSTWFAREVTGPYPAANPPNVMKYFDLESGEYLLITNSKPRPVILLKRTVCDWLNPPNIADHAKYWTCFLYSVINRDILRNTYCRIKNLKSQHSCISRRIIAGVRDRCSRSFRRP